MTTVNPTGTKLSPRQRKAIVAGTIGNTVEWVDWALYSIFAKIISVEFFPGGDETVALLSTLAVFAVGFVMRPVGAAVLGAYADRHGRKKGLTLTVGLMAGASFIIALTPNYGMIGVLAPVILLIARLLQGFSAGGEFGSSSAFLVESAARGRRAFAGSWQQVSVGGGVLIASLLGTIATSTLDEQDLHGWGWRVAFVLGGLLGLVGLWLRISVEETDSFTNTAGRRRVNPLKAMFTEHPGAALRVAGITIAGTLTYYIWVNYLPTYANITTGIPLSQALLSQTLCLVVFVVLLPFAGLVSDRFGRKLTLGVFAGGFVVLAWPMLHLLDNSFLSVFLVQLTGMLFLLGYSANCAVIMAEQFPPEVRATGIALPYALAVAVFGGTAPYVTTWLNEIGHRDLLWLYVSGSALISLVVYLTMPETKDKEFD
ncbi:MFS transporter [Amycolatopsis magusensis]|uniref:MHS family alpha-ketoglutarate permease-like MFS transporter n=1 Tax=Amycolatopsis magusensis TaxID=882444 RepID=A0ABS4PTB0_9PSEU|nr:MFS transporter [Amycolatopsis magusensis]MBP2182548.1 MHS family alpha-ketoglutarate permease-like MFS transporter [Amycolatopsis magusensis]MDI5980524.1 MFS transporter [Amycolatopsis magusensis]